MKFPPHVTITQKIQQSLYDLDVLKTSYALRRAQPDREANIRRLSLLKSSLYSARIEGNPLELSDVQDLSNQEVDVKKQEVSNLLYAYEHLNEKKERNFTIVTIREFHKEALRNISAEAGHLRIEESAIFNQAGVAIYLTPAPQNIRDHLLSLISYINHNDHPAPVVAGLAHVWFEKIHPFLDGNGRVGRLVSSFILKKGEYDLFGLVPFEEYLDTNRNLYYDALSRDRQDVTEFVEFYLTALVNQGKDSLTRVFEPEIPDPYVRLLPRRAEIMRIVADHKTVTFDFLSRRFRAVPTRTLHHDIAQLVKSGLLIKVGSTRGVSYTVSGNR